jgi:hypothetical protein
MFDSDENPLPTLDPSTFDRLRSTLAAKGSAAAIAELAHSLRQIGDLSALFYARLLEKRVELGVSPFPTGAASELPPATHEPYEEAIREAAREVGQLYLDQHDVRRAWFYFNMIGEPGPARKYIHDWKASDDSDPQAVIEIALYNGVDVARGFELVLERYGICNAITTFSQQDFSRSPEAKPECVRMLVRSLHEQLLERLKVDIAARGEPTPTTNSIPELIAGRDDLFADDAYHIDTSHLASVAQMSLELTDGPEVLLARDLCAYGEKLSDNFKQPADPPFENTYADYKVLLEVTGGINVESGLKLFHDKIEPGIAEGNTFPAEVCVNLLLRLGRKAEAIALAKKYLAGQTRPMSCPGVYELCQAEKDYAGLADAARQRADGVNFLASLIAAK